MGNVYENKGFQEVAKGIMRPGGLMLTERAVNYCAFPTGTQVIDVGCGTGATVELLRNNYQLEAIGIDPSPLLLEQAKQRNADLPLIQARGEELPLANQSVAGVLAECSLSVIANLERALAEFRRVLIPGGKLVISDIYARQPENVQSLRNLPFSCCLKGIMTEEEILVKLKEYGFNLLIWEDHSKLWKEFLVQIILSYGSLGAFWQDTAGGETDVQAVELAVQEAKPGYFLLIAGKGG